MSRVVAKLCYRNGKSILCNQRTKKWSCLIMQSTRGKMIFFSEVGLPLLLWKESRAWLILDYPGNAEGAWTLDYHCFPCKVSVAASLAGLKPMVEQAATWDVMRNPEQHQGKNMRWSSCWTKKERRAACSSPGAWGRQSSTAAWLSPACRMSHVFMRLLGSKWFLGKERVLLTQKK